LGPIITNKREMEYMSSFGCALKRFKYMETLLWSWL